MRQFLSKKFQVLNTSPRGNPWVNAFKHLSISFLIIFWLLLLWILRPKDAYGTDIYPLYAAAQALLGGFNPYDPELAAHFRAIWNAQRFPFASVGFVYPLPTVIGLWPILVLPLPFAVATWLGVGSLGSLLAVTIRNEWRSFVLLPFLFMPLHRTIIVKQPSLIWFSLIVVLIISMQKRLPPWLVAYCIVLLPAKPQNGLFFALAGLVWAWREERRSLPWIGVWGVGIWGASFLITPGWIADWLQSVRTYSAIGNPVSILPWALLLPLACLRLPWYAPVAALQVVFFPLSDIYSFLPLLLVWVGIGGPLALYGSALTWLWQFFPFSDQLTNAWSFVIIPLALCALWRSYGASLQKRMSNPSIADWENVP